MKKIFTAIFMIAAMLFIYAPPASSQLFVGVNAGVVDKKYDDTHTLGSLQVGYQTASNTDISYYISYDQRISITSKAGAPTWFGADAGIVWELKENTSLSSVTGYTYRYSGPAFTNINGWDLAGGIRFSKLPMSMEVYYVGGWYSLTVGWKGLMKKRN